jgi:hypothetical protein
MRVQQGPGTNEFKQILLIESFKIGPKAFRRGPKTKKWQIEAKPTWHLFWSQNNWFRPKNSAKRRAHDEARDQGIVQLKDSICFKSVQIGS